MRSNYLVLRFAAAAGVVMLATAFSFRAGASPLQFTGVCPSTVGHVIAGVAGAGPGNAPDCNLLFTFNADGSITTTGPGGTYESVEDALIGVVNNSGHTITSFVLTNPGVGIFGFDGDGIDVYVLPPTGSIAPNSTDESASTQCAFAGGCDTAAYGGPLGFYTGINAALDTGTINIIGGLASGTGAVNCPQFTPNSNPGTCDTTYFSLEEPVSLSAPPIVVTTPEPGTLGILAVALVGFGLYRRRNRMG